MKKQFQTGIVLMGLLMSSMGWAQGHVEGGGDDLPILFRQAKERAIAILKTITPQVLGEYGVQPYFNEVEIYHRYRLALVQDLESIPSFIFCRGTAERKQFFKSDGERTALTVHWPGAAVKINLDRCNENHITLDRAVALLWREAGRHVLEKKEGESEEEFMLRIEPDLDSLEDIAVKAAPVYDRLHLSQDSPWVLSTVKRIFMTRSGQPTLTLLIGSISGGALIWFSADRVSPGYVKFFMKVGAVLLWTVPVSLGAANADEGALDEKIYLDLAAQHQEKEMALSQDPENLTLQSDVVCLEIQILKITLYKIENVRMESGGENREILLQTIQAEIEHLKDRYQGIQQLLHP